MRQRLNMYGSLAMGAALGVLFASSLAARRAQAEAAVAPVTPATAGGTGPQLNEPEQGQRAEIPEIVDMRGVLTPGGRLVMEAGLQFGNSQLNRFTFRGVQILEALLIGAVEAEDSDRDFYSFTLGTRYGVTDRLEFELLAPYIRREERLSATIVQANADVALSRRLTGAGLGDAEAVLHYQLNGGGGSGAAFFIANLRYKAATGTSPFDVDRDLDGVEQELATGSGFESIEPSVTALYRSDPAVFFGNLGYLHSFEEDVNKTFGDQTIGRVEPGSATRLTLGMAYSINERASFTLGYKHDFIGKTVTEINETRFESSRLQVGTLLLGFSHGVNGRAAVSVSLQIGVTADAPDVLVDFRVPLTYRLFD